MTYAMLIGSIAAIVLVVRFGLCTGLRRIGGALNWSAKMRGQVTGYATSVPEAVALIFTALSGVWDAGLWNIASSNIINWGLLCSAVLFYRQHRELFQRQFLDEILFATVAVLVPLSLMHFKLDQSPLIIIVLFGFFALYKVLDVRLNEAPEEPELVRVSHGSLGIGLLFVTMSLVLIIMAGNYLGESAQAIVHTVGVPAWAVGWILGFATSVPEMTSLFQTYAAAKKRNELHLLSDTQEVLDNLTASNMANLGLIYPFGLAVFLLMR